MEKIFFAVFLTFITLPAWSQPANWEQVQKIMERKGVFEEDMFKVTYPRTDLNVKIGDVQVDPRVGLTSWVTFLSNMHTVVMGDLVLRPDEVMPVVKKLQDGKIGITALHNDLTGTSIPVTSLHFAASGDAVALAKAVKGALSVTGTPIAEAARPPETVPPQFSVVQYYLGPGTLDGSVLKYSFARNQTVIDNDIELPGFMGTSTSINFQASNGKVAATGDFVLTANEVDAVVKALSDSNITITAIGNRLLSETPRLFFLHFWAYDTPQAAASGIWSALQKINIRRVNE